MNQLSEEKLKEMREREAEDLAKLLSQKYNIPYLDLTRTTIDLDALKIVPEEEARAANLVVFQKTGKNLKVAILSPNPEPTKNLIKKLEQDGYKLTIYLVSEVGLERAFKRYAEVPEYTEIVHGIVEVAQEKLEEFIKQTETLDDLKNIFTSILSSKKTRRISDLLEVILAGAISSDASDIHLEPQENEIRLRLRIDGVLHDIFYFERKVYSLLLSRIKLVAGVKLNIHDEPQDGRFTIRLKGTDIEVRVSVIPEAYGETVVMRILNPETISIPLEELGMHPSLYKVIVKEIKRPNGMLLTTGPTGSGKTTTLYAFLKKIYSPELKIITLENPIEYHLKGIVQTQVGGKEGYTFASGLRAILRQDPDVIMVGEIRDKETADVALNAALTGHFVFSTLHTNNAAGTIPRLIDLGAEPNIIAPALNVSMAQRLVRKLCEACKEQVKPSEEEINTIKQIVESFPKSIEKPSLDNVYIWKAKGCRKCSGIGYKGRTGVFEAILIDDKIEKLILKKPTEIEIIEAAKDQGILNMQQDGILKVLQGITSLEELERVVGLV